MYYIHFDRKHDEDIRLINQRLVQWISTPVLTDAADLSKLPPCHSNQIALRNTQACPRENSPNLKRAQASHDPLAMLLVRTYILPHSSIVHDSDIAWPLLGLPMRSVPPASFRATLR